MENEPKKPIEINVPDESIRVNLSNRAEIVVNISVDRYNDMEEEMIETQGETAMYDILAILSQFGIDVFSEG